MTPVYSACRFKRSRRSERPTVNQFNSPTSVAGEGGPDQASPSRTSRTLSYYPTSARRGAKAANATVLPSYSLRIHSNQPGFWLRMRISYRVSYPINTAYPNSPSAYSNDLTSARVTQTLHARRPVSVSDPRLGSCHAPQLLRDEIFLLPCSEVEGRCCSGTLDGQSHDTLDERNHAEQHLPDGCPALR